MIHPNPTRNTHHIKQIIINSPINKIFKFNKIQYQLVINLLHLMQHTITIEIKCFDMFRFMVFNTTFNNISEISWQSNFVHDHPMIFHVQIGFNQLSSFQEYRGGYGV